MRRWLIVIALFGTACEMPVLLGKECAGARSDCQGAKPWEDDAEAPPPEVPSDDGRTMDEKPDGGRNGPQDMDAGSLDATTAQDAMQALDSAREDADLALFPLFANPSFELDANVPIPEGGFHTDLPVFITGPSPIDPWLSCRPAGGTSVHSSLGTVKPEDGRTFLTYGLSLTDFALLNGVAQELAEPLRKGQQYAFAIDVLLDTGPIPTATARLKIAAGNLSCIIGSDLTMSEEVRGGGWSKLCINFIPDEDVRTVLLLGAPELLNFTASLYIDNIRFDAECAKKK